MAEMESLLDKAVRRQLHADVPVGILLSGGVDSSLVTAMAAKVTSSPVKTFTVTFPGHAEYDESPHAQLIASHFGTEHMELAAGPASVELLPLLARQYDDPIADSSMIPTYMVSKLIRRHATVAIGGDGGDELFGGYQHYGWVQRLDDVKRRVPSGMRSLISTVAERAMPVGMRGRNHLIGLQGDIAQSIAHVNVLFDRRTRSRLLGYLPEGSSLNEAPEDLKMRLGGDGTALQRMCRADLRSYLPDDILVKVDRASMLTSLEVRAPLLDYRVMEFALRKVPDSLKATRTEAKLLPKLLAKRLLPSGFDFSRKQGFSLPLNKWFQGEWGRYVEGVLSRKDCTFAGDIVKQLIAGQRRGHNNSARLFCLAFFELWRREHRITVPT